MNFEINHILDKALEMFLKFGIKSVSMDDIANELGISKKTLYNYFKDKNELVQQVEDYRYDQRIEKFEKINRQNMHAIDEIFEFHLLFRSYIQNYSQAFEYDLKKYYSELFCKQYIQRLKYLRSSVIKNMEKGITEGVFRKDINIDILADYKVTAMMCMAENEQDSQKRNEEYFNEIFKLNLFGILSEKGIKEYNNKTKEPSMRAL